MSKRVRSDLMTQRAQQAGAPLAEFANSPVVEVAMAVAFQPIFGLRTVELGQLWLDRFRPQFRKVREQPRVEMQAEQFGAPASGPGLSFQLLDTPLLPRLWFLNEDETELVQVQNNWFARNWRQLETGVNYPHYPRIRGPFEDDLGALVAYVKKGDLGTFTPTQCELTYTNHIAVADARPTDLREVLAVFASGSAPGPLGQPETIRAAFQWVIRNDDDEPVGRLHVTAEPAIRRSDNKELVVLTVTARGRPLGDGINGVLSFLDRGHELAVRTFVAVTTKAMQREWGMK